MKKTIKLYGGMVYSTEPRSGEGSPLDAAVTKQKWSLFCKLHGLKSAWKLILIHITLIAVIGFGVAACGDDGSDPGDPGPGTIGNPFLGPWVFEDWSEHGGDGMAVLFKDDGTVVFNGGFATGTYDHTASPATLTVTVEGEQFNATIAVNGSSLTLTGIDGAAGLYQKGGLLTLTDAPASNYRFYICSTPLDQLPEGSLMTDEGIKSFVGRTPCGNDIAGGTINPIFWDGTTSGTYHVIIRTSEGGGTFKYKENVVFVDGKNTTTFGFSDMRQL